MQGRIVACGGVLIALAALGCSSSSSNNGKQVGELGRGTFAYACTSMADAQCNDNADVAIVDPSTNLPTVAVGGTFQVTYYSNGNQGSTPDGHTDTVDAAFIDVDTSGMSYVAKRAGYGVIYGVPGGSSCHTRMCDGTAPQDLVHMYLQPVDHIEFAHSAVMGGSFKGEATTPGGGMVMFTVNGQPATQLFRVVPMTKDRKLLAGSLPIMWTSSNTMVGQITTDPTQNIITLQLSTAGTTMLTATVTAPAGALTGTLTVTVM